MTEPEAQPARPSTKKSWNNDYLLMAMGLAPLLCALPLLMLFATRSRSVTDLYDVTWRFYRSRSGFEDQYVSLFMRGTYALYKDEAEHHKIRSVHVYRSSATTSPGVMQWTLAMAIEFPRSLTAPPAPTAEAINRVFPDRRQYDLEKIEESRLVDSEWESTSREVVPVK